jgi:hypothetical protein
MSTEVKAKKTKVKKVNPWTEHVKKYRSENPGMSFKEALKGASETYKKGGVMVVEEPKEVKPKKTEKAKKTKKPVKTTKK